MYHIDIIISFLPENLVVGQFENEIFK